MLIIATSAPPFLKKSRKAQGSCFSVCDIEAHADLGVAEFLVEDLAIIRLNVGLRKLVEELLRSIRNLSALGQCFVSDFPSDYIVFAVFLEIHEIPQVMCGIHPRLYHPVAVPAIWQVNIAEIGQLLGPKLFCAGIRLIPRSAAYSDSSSACAGGQWIAS